MRTSYELSQGVINELIRANKEYNHGCCQSPKATIIKKPPSPPVIILDDVVLKLIVCVNSYVVRLK